VCFRAVDVVVGANCLRGFLQVVVSEESPLVGTQLNDSVFQDDYGATIVGIRGAEKFMSSPFPSGSLPSVSNLESTASGVADSGTCVSTFTCDPACLTVHSA
jgi:TrkA-C domain